MTTMQLATTQAPPVGILHAAIRIVDLADTDPHVYRVLAQAADPDEITQAVLRMGAQATLIADADLDAQVVEQRFEGLARSEPDAPDHYRRPA